MKSKERKQMYIWELLLLTIVIMYGVKRKVHKYDHLLIENKVILPKSD